MVIIYEVSPKNEMESFCIVSFEDESTEVAWGMGYTPKEALRDAERNGTQEAILKKKRRESVTER